MIRSGADLGIAASKGGVGGELRISQHGCQPSVNAGLVGWLGLFICCLIDWLVGACIGNNTMEIQVTSINVGWLVG